MEDRVENIIRKFKKNSITTEEIFYYTVDDTRIVEQLIKRLNDDDSDLSYVALMLGISADTRAVDPLIEVLSDEELYWSSRQAVVKALGDIGDPRALDALTTSIMYNHNRVRIAAGEALGKIGGPRVIKVLINSLTKNISYTRREIALTLVKIGQIVIPDLLVLLQQRNTVDNDLLLLESLKVLIRLSPTLEQLKTIKSMLISINSCNKELNKYIQSLLAIIETSKVEDCQMIEELVKSFEDEKCEVRLRALKELKERGDIRTVDPLIKALNDEDPQVQELVIITLGEIGDSWAASPLGSLIFQLCRKHHLFETYRRIGAVIVEALAKIGSEEAFSKLLHARNYSRNDLGEVITNTLYPLNILLKTNDARAHQRIISDLVLADRSRAVELLIAIFDYLVILELEEGDLIYFFSEETVKFILSQIVINCDKSRIHELLLEIIGEKDEEYWSSSILAVGDPVVVDCLAGLLKNEDLRVRWRTAAVLGEIGDSRAVEPLIAALDDEGMDHNYVGGYDIEVKKEAAKALTKINDLTNVVKPMITLLFDNDGFKRYIATNVLVKVGQPAIPELVSSLQL
ncbi:MAG: HEAT repeat domain-containing protein, partial [Candidatus Hodarchaeales archaeon]